MAQLLHDTGGDIPDGILPPLEAALPGYSGWKPRSSPWRKRRKIKPFAPENLPLVTATQADASRTLHAMLQGARAYLMDKAVERVITSDRYGPVGTRCFTEAPEVWLHGVGSIDHETSQGAVLGFQLGDAIGESLWNSCADPSTSPLSHRALARFTFLSSIYSGMTHRLEELERMDREGLLKKAYGQLRPLGGGGSPETGQFIEVVRTMVPDASPHELATVAMRSMGTLHNLTRLRAAASTAAIAMLSWDGETALESLPPQGRPLHPRWFRIAERHGGPEVVLTRDWSALVDPTLDKTFAASHRAHVLDDLRPRSLLGCAAMVRSYGPDADAASRGQDESERPDVDPIPSSFSRAYAATVRAATVTSVFDPTGPRPSDLRPGPYLLSCGARALDEVDALVAVHAPEHRPSTLAMREAGRRRARRSVDLGAIGRPDRRAPHDASRAPSDGEAAPGLAAARPRRAPGRRPGPGAGLAP